MITVKKSTRNHMQLASDRLFPQANRNTEDLPIECRIDDVRSTRCIVWPEPILSWAEN